MQRLALILLGMSTVPAAAAGLSPERDTAYRLEIVCRIQPHRVLTPAWSAEFRRDLRDSLQAALGPIATVKVFDPDHEDLRDQRPPLWSLILDQGLSAFDGPATGRDDPRRAVTGVKTHFMMVDYVDGRYVITARQHDGSTGLAGPVVRQLETADRGFSARLAGLMVGQDFGVVGSITGTKTDTATFTLRGAELGSLSAWCAKGDLFVVSALRPAGRGGAMRGEAIPETYLQVTDGPTPEGQCTARILSRYVGPLDADTSLIGYRCLRLGTSTAPVQLRLVNERGLPQKTLLVRAAADNFARNLATAESLAVGEDGVYRGTKPYAGVAFVTVSSGSTNLAQIPIPIIDGPASVHEVKTQGGAGLDNFEVALRRLLRQIDDTAIILDDRNKQLSAKTKSGKENAAARDLAKKTRSWLDAAITDHSSALRRLTTEAQALKLDPKRLATFQSALDDLRARSKSLGGLVVKLDEVIAAENDPSRQEAAVKMKQQLAQAESLLQEDDFEGALRLFDTILKSPNPPADLAAKVKVIRDAWAIRNPAHASARKFAYEEWPKLTTLEQVQAAIPKAREALKTFTDVKDYLSPRRFRRSELPIRNALTEQLRAMTDEEKQAKAEAFKQADTDVQQISDQAKKLIDQGEGGSRAAPEN